MYGLAYSSTFYGGTLVPAIHSELAIWVGGQDVSDDYVPGSLTIRATIGTKWTAGFSLTDADGSLDVLEGMDVRIRLEGQLMFGGSVNRPREIFPALDPSSTRRVVEIQATDHNHSAFRHLFNGVYTDQAAGDIIRDIVDRSEMDLDGVSTDGVQDGPTLSGTLKFQLASAAQGFDRVADLAGYVWLIDASKVLHFLPRIQNQAPWQITATSRTYKTLTRERVRNEYRNIQYILGGHDIGAERIRKFQGDSKTQVFTLEAGVAEEPRIFVNSVENTNWGIRGLDDDTDAAGFDWFWSKGEPAISQNTQDTAPGAVEVEIRYKPLLRLFQSVVDAEEIQNRKNIEGGSGRYSALYTDAEVEDADVAQDLAEMLLAKRGRINTILRITTHKMGLLPGQLQTIDLPTPEGIDDDFLITQVSINHVGLRHYNVSYQCIDNDLPGGWPEFFKTLLDTGRQSVVGGNEIISDIAQVFESIEIADDSSGTASGDSRGTSANDPYTVFQVGTAVIGKSEIGSYPA
jgi:hypothetical protein